MKDGASRPRWEKLALAGVVACGMLAAWRLGLLGAFADPGATKQLLVGLGVWGYAAYVLAYALLQPFGVPGTAFVMVAPLIWSWPEAFALSMTGTMAASVVGFSFARFVARDWVTPRIPARLRRFDDALARRGFATVAALRFVLWMPPALHAFLGVSRVGFWAHFWGSLVGYAPPLFLSAYFGARLFEWLRALPPSAWACIGAGALVVALGVWLVRRRRAVAEPEPG
jgi:uncharacterized membrane protein YdjX (TVP38/TMEM64 family)